MRTLLNYYITTHPLHKQMKQCKKQRYATLHVAIEKKENLREHCVNTFLYQNRIQARSNIASDLKLRLHIFRTTQISQIFRTSVLSSCRVRK